MTTLHATYIGTATVLLELRRGEDRMRLLTDPVFDDAGARYTVSGMAPLRYTSLRPTALPPQALPPIDQMLVSHDQHGDNFDDTGRRLAHAARRVLTTRAAARRLAKNGLPNVMGLARGTPPTLPSAVSLSASPRLPHDTALRSVAPSSARS